jgi:GNAT superfamily N-acetyltransferase
MTIHQLKPRDAVAYRLLRLEALRRASSAFITSYAEEKKEPISAFAKRLSAKNVWFFGVFDKNTLIGTLGFSIEPRAKLSHVGLLFGMYVAAPLRRRGIGSALIDHAVAHARKLRSIRYLKLSVISKSPAARSLYAACGFKTFGLEPGAIRLGREYLDEEYMLLKLRGK